MNQETLVNRSEKVLLGNYGRLPIAMVSSEGSTVVDEAGKKYLDFFVGFGGGGVCGHSHPKVVEAISSQASKIIAHGNLVTSEPQVRLAEMLLEHSIPGRVFFCHSGAEANEAALKCIRKRSNGKRYKVICFNNSFHGRTMGGLSMTPESFQVGLGPMLPGAVRIDYGDIDALVAAASDPEVGGVIFEPIQGEGGINEGTIEFASKLREVCNDKDLLLVADEVWSAPGRTGEYFAYQHLGISPDIITMGKALGGGLPLAATIVSEEHKDILGPGTHGCTLGGNPVCAAAGVSVLELLEDEGLCKRAVEIEIRIRKLIEEKNIPSVQEVKGKGLMIGLKLVDEKEASSVFSKLLDSGLIAGVAKNNVLRIAPAMNVSEADLDRGLGILVDTLLAL